jgi:hypothetical protein
LFDHIGVHLMPKNRIQKLFYQLLSLIVIFSTLGCHYPMRLASDGSTAIPLSGLGDGLPVRSATAAEQGAVSFDCLYVRVIYAGSERLAAILRFWPTGEVLERIKILPATGDWNEALIVASDGDLLDEQIRISGGSAVGRYVVLDHTIYVEMFRLGVERWEYETSSGQLTEDGIVLDRRRKKFFPLPYLSWYSIPPERFRRIPVGQMMGKPTW